MSEIKDKKREAILEAAGTLFQKFGYSKTSMDEIAQAAFVGKGTLYYYFSCKEELFVAVLSEFVEVFIRQLTDLVEAEETFEGKFRVYFETPARLMGDNISILVEALQSMPLKYQGLIEEFRAKNKERIMAVFRGILEFGIAQGLLNPELPVEQFILVVNEWLMMGDENLAVLDQRKLCEKMSRDQDLILQIILNGIIKRG